MSMRSAAGPRPRGTSPVRLALLVCGTWALLAFFLGVQIYLNARARGQTLPLESAIADAMRRYSIYAVLTFPILWLCRRYPLEPGRRAVSLLAHAVACAVFVVLYAALRLPMAVNPETMQRVPISLENAVVLARGNLFELFWMYCSIVTVVLAVQYRRQIREREIGEAHLKRQMAEYELQVLKLQLHPHFLFNTLNGISTLMLRDTRTAREMLIRLSELLRIALARSRDNEVPLRDEMEFLRAYIELEQMRFGERLHVVLEIDPDTLDARVPNMIIQPLVENAIEHGIARIRSGGTLELAAESREGRLRIRIINDGPLGAMGRKPANGSGIGLGNARLRLSQLYGDAYSLRIADRREGGAALDLEIPLRSDASPGAAPA